MTTRRDILKAGAGLAAILASGRAPAAVVRSMLAARASICGGKKLPYDAEVEYLWNDGTSGVAVYTGLTVDDDKWEIDWKIQQTGAPSALWASLGPTQYKDESSESTRCITWSNATNGMYAGYRRSANAQNLIQFDISSAPRRLILSYMRLKAYAGDELMNTFSLYAPSGSQAADVNMRISMSSAKMRLYYFKMLHDGVTMFDAYPVRFTNALGNSDGALYDRVTKKLFGSFLYGPDRHPLTANS